MGCFNLPFRMDINGVYWGYNPLISTDPNHLLTSWDIQVDHKRQTSLPVASWLSGAKPFCVFFGRGRDWFGEISPSKKKPSFMRFSHY